MRKFENFGPFNKKAGRSKANQTLRSLFLTK